MTGELLAIWRGHTEKLKGVSLSHHFSEPRNWKIFEITTAVLEVPVKNRTQSFHQIFQLSDNYHQMAPNTAKVGLASVPNQKSGLPEFKIT